VNRSAWRLVSESDAFSRSVELGLLESHIRPKLWMQLLKPHLLSEIWSLGLATTINDEKEIIEWRSKSFQFVLDANNNTGYGMALQASVAKTIQSMSEFNTSGRVRGAFASCLKSTSSNHAITFIYFLQQHGNAEIGDEPGDYYTSSSQITTIDSTCKKNRLVECISCGMWYISVSGHSSTCQRCREIVNTQADCCIYLSPAGSVIRWWQQQQEDINESLHSSCNGYASLVAVAFAEYSEIDEAMAVIEVDVPRTVPSSQGPELAASLRRILAAYAVFAPGIGYCQGMSYIAFRLLLRLGGNEEIAFWSLVSVLETRNLKAFYLPGLRRVRISCFQLDKLTVEYIPNVAKILDEKLGLPSVCYAIVWIQTLFAEGRALPDPAVDRLWDALFVVDSPAEARALLMRIMLALISLLGPYLATVRDAEEALKLLQTLHNVPTVDANKLFSSARQKFSAVDALALDKLELSFPDDDQDLLCSRLSTDANPNYSDSFNFISSLAAKASSRQRIPSYFDRAVSTAYSSLFSPKSPTGSRKDVKASSSWRWSSLYSSTSVSNADSFNKETAAIEEIEVHATHHNDEKQSQCRHFHKIHDGGKQTNSNFHADLNNSEQQATSIGRMHNNRGDAFLVERANL